MRYYQDLMHTLKSWHISEQEAQDKIAKGTLDDLYCHCSALKSELEKAAPLLLSVGALDANEFEKAKAHASNFLDRVLNLFINWFKTHDFIGNEEAWQAPDLIVVLGADAHTRTLRAQEAAHYFKRFENAQGVLSGGGFDGVQSEAFLMHQTLKAEGVQNTIHLEEDSMDTIGNALFTKLLLKKLNLLSSKKILIITSKFHTMRALFYFQELFSKESKIAAHGVSTLSKNLEKISAHEFISQHDASLSLKIFDHSRPQDDQDVLIKLLWGHALYKNRYDLMRKFLQSLG